MPDPIVTPMILTATKLLADLIRAGIKAKELSRANLRELREKLDKEFKEIPEWDQL